MHCETVIEAIVMLILIGSVCSTHVERRCFISRPIEAENAINVCALHQLSGAGTWPH